MDGQTDRQLPRDGIGMIGCACIALRGNNHIVYHSLYIDIFVGDFATENIFQVVSSGVRPYDAKRQNTALTEILHGISMENQCNLYGVPCDSMEIPR